MVWCDDMVVKNQGNSARHVYLLMVLATAMLWVSGCVMVGPNYLRPPAPTAATWLDPGDPAVQCETPEIGAWWTVFAHIGFEMEYPITSRRNLAVMVFKLWAHSKTVTY
jgi:hypothetical protein